MTLFDVVVSYRVGIDGEGAGTVGSAVIVGGSLVGGIIGVLVLVCLGWCLFYACREYYEDCVRWRNSRNRSHTELQETIGNDTNELDDDDSLFSSRYYAVASVKPPAYSVCMDLSNDPPSYRLDWDRNRTDQSTVGVSGNVHGEGELDIERTDDRTADHEQLLQWQATSLIETHQPPD